MKRPMLRLVCTLVVMCLLMAGFGAFLYMQGVKSVQAEQHKRQTLMADGIGQTLDLLEEQIRDASLSFRERLKNSALLMSRALKGRVTEDGYEGDEVFPNGMVVRMSGDTITYPAAAPKNVDLTTSILSDDAGLFSTLLTESDSGDKKPVLAIARSIGRSYYYTGWRTQEEMRRYILAHVALDEVLEAAEDVYNGLLVFVDMQDEELPFLWRSPDLSEVESGKSIGLTRDMLQEETGEVSIDGKTYIWLRRDSEELNSTILFLRPSSAQTDTASGWMLIILALASLILAGVVTWVISILSHVKNRLLTAPEHRRYNPARVKKVMAVLGVLGALIIFSCSALVQALGSLQADTESAQTALNIMYSRIQEEEKQLKNAREAEENWVLYDARRLASLIGEDPSIRTREAFSQFSNALGIQYIMLFDENGDEMVCSGDYVHFTLGENPEDPLTDFRRLLNGVEAIVHETQRHEATDLTSQLVGVRVTLKENTYGALLLALPEGYITDEAHFSENEILRSVTPPGAVSLSADLESGRIVSSSMEELPGMEMARLGIQPGQTGEGILGEVNIGGRRYDATAMREASRLFVYLSSPADSARDVLPYAFSAALAFAVMFFILSAVLLYDYTKKNYEAQAVVGSSRAYGASVEVETPDGTFKHSVDPSKRWAFIYSFWWNRTPAEKAMTVVQWMLFVFFALYFLMRDGGENPMSSSVISYLLSGRWTPGFNIFALTAIALLASALVVSLMVLRFVIGLISNVMGTKGETVCRLLISFLEYAAALSFLFYAFGYLGFDTSGLVASLSLISLAVSLGSRDLVTDILAGISIVFEGEYQVGDVVEIGGYRGKVQEIGIRSTKLMGDGGNIKIISNRDVKNVVNMTRMNSWQSIELTIAMDQPLKDIEKILKAEFPGIGARNREIISGPFYQGVTAIAPGSATIRISAECREENIGKVRQILNAEIYELFTARQIHLA